MAEVTIAGALTEGDYLPGLDNGYVTEVEADVSISLGVGTSHRNPPYVLPEGYVCITMSDPDGAEFYLLCPADMRVEKGDGNG